jgi:hypothetical protein
MPDIIIFPFAKRAETGKGSRTNSDDGKLGEKFNFSEPIPVIPNAGISFAG